MTQPPRKSWLGRNWFWFIPVGCIGMLAIAIGFVALLVMAVFGMIKSSDAYKEAIAQAKASPAVQSALGTPIEEGLLVTGNVNVNNDSGEANLAIPLSGPNGAGTLYVEAVKSAGAWSYSTLRLDTGSEQIDVLDDTSDAETTTF
jgi:FlaG/FlaF family flagellin (archaellin)